MFRVSESSALVAHIHPYHQPRLESLTGPEIGRTTSNGTSSVFSQAGATAVALHDDCSLLCLLMVAGRTSIDGVGLVHVVGCDKTQIGSGGLSAEFGSSDWTSTCDVYLLIDEKHSDDFEGSKLTKHLLISIASSLGRLKRGRTLSAPTPPPSNWTGLTGRHHRLKLVAAPPAPGHGPGKCSGCPPSRAPEGCPAVPPHYYTHCSLLGSSSAVVANNMHCSSTSDRPGGPSMEVQA